MPFPCLDLLNREVLDDLDPDKGGVGWWHPQLGWRDCALLGDYLLGAVSGAETALQYAADEAARHRKMLVADLAWLRAQWRAGEEVPLRAPGSRPAERARELDISLEGTFLHLYQALDRIAAAVAIVAALKTNVLRVEWGAVDKVARGDDARLTAKVLAAEGTPGRELQGAVLDAHGRWQDFGPTDWLPWMRRTRSTQTHRAAKLDLLWLAGSRRDLRLVHTLYRQPEWHDVEAFVRPGAHLDEMFIAEDSDAILDGLVGSTSQYIDELCSVLLDAWRQRRAEPGMLPQPGDTWRRAEDPDLAFDGYGAKANVHRKGEFRVHPDGMKRLAAALVMDGGRDRWRARDS